MRKIYWVGFISILNMLNGCMQVPYIQENKIETIKDIGEDNKYELMGLNYDVESINWWEYYEDENINYLVGLLLEHNKSLRISDLNIDKLDLKDEMINRSDEVKVNINESYTRQKYSENGVMPPPFAGKVFNYNQLSSSFNYSLDYLNNKNTLKLKNEEEKLGLKYQKEALELDLETQLIKNYLYLVYLNKLEKITHKMKISNSILREKVEKKISIGSGKKEDLISIKNDEILLSKKEEEIKTNKKITESVIKSLIGDFDVVIDTNEKWIRKDEAPVNNLSISVLRDRPDIKYYLSNIYAQRLYLKSLIKDFYPNISINGDIGLQKVGVKNLLSLKNNFFDIIPSISLPILDGGQRKLNYKIAGKDLNIFIEEYNNQIYKSVSNINTNIYKVKQSYEDRVKVEELYKNGELKLSLINQKLKLGKESELNKILEEKNLLNLEESKLNSELDYLNQELSLMSSIGGKIKR